MKCDLKKLVKFINDYNWSISQLERFLRFILADEKEIVFLTKALKILKEKGSDLKHCKCGKDFKKIIKMNKLLIGDDGNE